MPTQFANTLNTHPIYADRAEKDAAGNTIATTYQEKLTAGTGITIDSSNVISATGGGGGSTYTAGNGIDITSDVISVQVTSPNAGDIVTLDCDGHLVDSGVAPSDLQPKLTAGSNITIDANNVISASGGGGGTSYTAGDGISISGTTISAKIDNSTITTNASGELVANGGGGGGSGATVYKFNGVSSSQTLFTVDGITFAFDDLTYNVTLESSTVSTVHATLTTVSYYNGQSSVGGKILGVSSADYAGLNISGAQKLFSVTDHTTQSYPAEYEITIFYDKSSTHHVIKMSVFVFFDPYVAHTLYFSVTNG